MQGTPYDSQEADITKAMNVQLKTDMTAVGLVEGERSDQLRELSSRFIGFVIDQSLHLPEYHSEKFSGHYSGDHLIRLASKNMVETALKLGTFKMLMPPPKETRYVGGEKISHAKKYFFSLRIRGATG